MLKFEVGAVVQLKSGGPAMTIKWIENEEAYCQWFTGDKVAGESFPLHSIKLKE